MSLLAHREGDFHATEEIALHPVGARQEQFAGAIVAEIEDARVFEEAADDRPHADVFRHAREFPAAARTARG